MQMKIYPWHINCIPTGLYNDSHWSSEEQETITEAKLKTLLKLNKTELGILTEQSQKAVPEYKQACTLLKLDPQIRMMWTKESGSNKIPLGEVRERVRELKRDYKHAGYEEDSIKRKVRAYYKEVRGVHYKENEKEPQKYKIGYDNFEKMRNSIQYHLWCSIESAMRNQRVHFGPRRPIVKAFKISDKEEDREITKTSLNTLYGQMGRVGKDGLKKLIKASDIFYMDGVNNKIRDRKTEPPQHVFIVQSLVIPRCSEIEDVYMPGNNRYQRFSPRKPIAAFMGHDLYVDTQGPLIDSEEITYDNANQCWTEADDQDKWLCVNPRPNAKLLGYNDQPATPKGEMATKIKKRSHQIGFEVEFDTPYNKGSCIRSANGRPLTPVRVLDDYGWALCPDSSVGGGELKSPIIGFTSADKAEQILDQIPEEIQKFINLVNKGEDCGGHLNYSTPLLGVTNAMQCVMAWGFVFPLMYPNRVDGKPNPNGRVYRTFTRIDEPTYKYQWLRQKKNCFEVRVFPAHWDIQQIIWRAQLVAMMIEDGIKENERLNKSNAYPTYTIANYPHYNWAMVRAAATDNWQKFKTDKLNPIREMVIGSFGMNKIREQLGKEKTRSMINIALGIPAKELLTIE